MARNSINININSGTIYKVKSFKLLFQKPKKYPKDYMA